MTRVCVVIWACLTALAAAAQEATYIQVEAHPSRQESVAAAQSYEALTGDVSGFVLGGSWYAVVLGPYSEAVAESELERLRRSGRIPRDSYLTTLENYGARFYPKDDAEAEPRTTPEPPAGEATEETPAEARRAERRLDARDRARVQTALADAGAYDGPIDSDFGPATRRAMADWQAANGYRATGVLTTAQRSALMEAYRSVLDGLGLKRVSNDEAGIEVAMPTALVAYDGTDSPFVRYEPTGDVPVRVLLISQPGDRATLGGLFEIMQTLEIVPPAGPRQRRATSFDIVGRNDEIVSTTYAELAQGEIKGFTLVWPAGDERRRERVLARMRSSFTRIPGVLPKPAAAETPAPDLLAGLELRRPERDRSGFYVDGSGAVLTTSEAVRSCQRVTLDDTIEAEVAAADDALGLALLRPRSSLAPLGYARFRAVSLPPEAEVAVAGYPFGGALPAPSLNFGRLAEAAGGDAARNRLELDAEPGETGGPVLDASGGVLGILLPRDDGARRYPDGVSFAAGAGPIGDFLSAAGLSAAAADGGDDMPPAQLTRLAAAMTVVVNCWD